jgi:hypothetical protein
VSIKTSDLKVGDILHDVHSERQGNTMCRAEGHWEVYVRAVADDGSWADLSWNGNRPTRYYGKTSYKRHPKEWIRAGLYGDRTCCLCHAKETAGHEPDCEHPRAIAAHKRAAKAAP